jgi:predicted lipoprotein with Yx(FWY)xxD motif
MTRLPTIIIAGVAAAAIGAGAASADYNSPSSSGYNNPTKAATVKVRSTKLGKVLVNGSGVTLYLFEKDKGGKSSCSGACATNWPPLLTKGRAHAGSGARSSKLGTTKRADGTTQVTYGGHPLYTFKLDATKPGSVKGQGIEAFGAEWYAVSSAGRAVDDD